MAVSRPLALCERSFYNLIWKALSRMLLTRRHFVVSDHYYQVNDVIIDEFIRVRMRQQSERRFFPLTWDRERSRRRSWTGRFSEVSGVSAHESALGLDTANANSESQNIW